MSTSTLSKLSFNNGDLSALEAMTQLFQISKKNVCSADVIAKDIVLLQKGKQALRFNSGLSLWKGDPENAKTLGWSDINFEKNTVNVELDSGRITTYSVKEFFETLEDAFGYADYDKKANVNVFGYKISIKPYFYFADASGNPTSKPFNILGEEDEDKIFKKVYDASKQFNELEDLAPVTSVRSTTIRQHLKNDGVLEWYYPDISKPSQGMIVTYHAPHGSGVQGKTSCRLNKQQISRLQAPL